MIKNNTKPPLRSPDDSCVSRRAKPVSIPFKKPTRGEISHMVIDATGLKVFGEDEWKAKKYGQEKRRVWRKLHPAVDAETHEVICADLSLKNVTDAEAFPGLIRQTHRKIRAACAAVNVRQLLASGICRQKSGGGEATAYWEQYLLEMAHSL